ncbi:serine/threonine-protein kinase 12-like isoform X2 [Tasmannia lanceolata]|uniref:serine/threonine-protein kinase 12-like isoform X2 n=1 Tax=Tasmannia lanceolata TaxID=3420 RepID=UPI0040639F4C
MDPEDFDMQLIGSFLSCASRGDRVGLNQMLREGTSPDVQDYDKRTALHLAASEGHASIVELLIQYNANVNLEDRWHRTPLTDARLYGHRDICRILEVNGGKDAINDHPLNFPREQGLNEVNIDPSELDFEHSSIIEQETSVFGRHLIFVEEIGLVELTIPLVFIGFWNLSLTFLASSFSRFGVSEKVKWRGTWVLRTIVKTETFHPETIKLSAKDIFLLRELRHPNILQFLGAIVHGEEMILITEYLSRGNLGDILRKKVRLDILTSLRFALDIARGMSYLHQHKPNPIVHNNLSPKNLLQDEGGHLKIGEYWVQMLYEKIHLFEENCQRDDKSSISCNSLCDTKKDLHSFAIIFYVMLEGRALLPNVTFDITSPKSFDVEPKFKLSRCPVRIQQLIRSCLKPEPSERPTTFASVIEILEEESMSLSKPGCPVC